LLRQAVLVRTVLSREREWAGAVESVVQSKHSANWPQMTQLREAKLDQECSMEKEKEF
jgi:hypothetical protein